MNTLTPEDKELLRLISSSLTSTPTVPDLSVDYSKVWKEAHAQTVSSFCFSSCDISSLDQALQTEIRSMLKKRIERNVKIISSHALIHCILTSARIQYTIIKGYASGLYYPDSITRSYGDVDFLIDKADFEKATQVLTANGFVKRDRNHITHDIFDCDGVRYEMHFEPAGIPSGKMGELVRNALRDTISTARPVSTDFGDMYVPDDFHHGLITLLHIAHHLTGEGIGLRQICDWACFCNTVKDESVYLKLTGTLKTIGLYDFACIITACCNTYLDCKINHFTDTNNSSLIEKLIADILEGGNFGQKDTDRGHEAMLISNHGKEGVGNKSKTGLLFQSANNIVYNNWQFTKKAKILLPVGWAFFGTRYIIRSLLGKRPSINIKKTITAADERIDLYKQFHLFETED